MKIGIFTDTYLPQPNGVATSVESAKEGLELRKHTVYVFAPKEPGYTDDLNVYRLTSLKINRQPEFRLALCIPGKTLLKAINFEFDIIHGHGGGPLTMLGLQIARLKNIPFVTTYHTLWSHYTHYFFKGKIVRPKMMELASKVFANRCDYIIAPTQRVENELISYGVTKPISVIPSGIVLSAFKKREGGFLRSMFSIKKSDPILLYVGRLGKEKSVELIIDAFKFVHKEKENSHLVIVGDGPELPKLKKRISTLGLESSIHFTHVIDHKEIAKVYADSDIFVFASKTETQGMVLLEALAAELPVVAVKDLAFEGILIDSYNSLLSNDTPKDFAQKVIQLLENKKLHASLSSNALRSVEKFSIESVTAQLEILYDFLIKNHKTTNAKMIWKTIRYIKRKAESIFEFEIG